MSSNSFGKIFRLTTFGESHGSVIGVVVDNVPPGINLDLHAIQYDLDRRKPFQNIVTSQRKESDSIEIISGTENGLTLGSPITVIVRNEGHNPDDYTDLMDVFRPGTADFTYFKKYGIHAKSGGGRASGRETVGRVIAGAIAKQILKKYEIEIQAYTNSIGTLSAKTIDFDEIERNPVRCPDKDVAEHMFKKLLQLKEEGDSIGGTVCAVIRNCPAGLGEPVFNKLDSLIAAALMSIGSVKAVEIGDGIKSARMKGSKFNDPIDKNGFVKNSQGGIIGGISTGQDITVKIFVKPTPSIQKKQKTVNRIGEEVTISITGNHDPCICPRIVPVVEAMLSIVILDLLMIHKSKQV